MGRPLPGFELRVADGELQVRGRELPDLLLTATSDARAVRRRVVATGDVVRRDDDGYLWFEGRDDDLILSAGYRIGPFEVESALLSHPAVAEAAAVSAPDRRARSGRAGDRRPARRRAGEALAAELQEHVKRESPPPTSSRASSSSPTSCRRPRSGKIKRAELRLS